MCIRDFFLFAFVIAASHAHGQTATGSWAVTAQSRYQISPNITYLVENNYEDKLDIYYRRNAPGPQPTLIYIHGGG